MAARVRTDYTLAVHESAHACVAFHHGILAESMTIIDDGKTAAGHCVFPDRRTTPMVEAAIAFAGFHGEHLADPDAADEFLKSSGDWERMFEMLALAGVHDGAAQAAALERFWTLVEKLWPYIERLAAALEQERTLSAEQIGVLLADCPRNVLLEAAA